MNTKNLSDALDLLDQFEEKIKDIQFSISQRYDIVAYELFEQDEVISKARDLLNKELEYRDKENLKSYTEKSNVRFSD